MSITVNYMAIPRSNMKRIIIRALYKPLIPINGVIRCQLRWRRQKALAISKVNAMLMAITIKKYIDENPVLFHHINHYWEDSYDEENPRIFPMTNKAKAVSCINTMINRNPRILDYIDNHRLLILLPYIDNEKLSMGIERKLMSA